MSENICPWFHVRTVTFLVPATNCQFQVCESLTLDAASGFHAVAIDSVGQSLATPRCSFWIPDPQNLSLRRQFCAVQYWEILFCRSGISREPNDKRETEEGCRKCERREVGCGKLRAKIKENQRDFERSILSVCGTASHVARLQNNSFLCDLNPSKVVTGHSCSSLFPAQWRQKITKILSWLPGWPGLHSKTLWAGKEGRAEGGEGEVSERKGEEGLESVMHVCSLAKHYFRGLWFQFYVWVLSLKK